MASSSRHGLPSRSRACLSSLSAIALWIINIYYFCFGSWFTNPQNNSSFYLSSAIRCPYFSSPRLFLYAYEASYESERACPSKNSFLFTPAHAFPFSPHGGMHGGGGSPPNENKESSHFHNQPPPPNYEGKDFYKLLGVTTTATDEQIRRQYRRLARQLHPDVRAAALDKQQQKAKEASKGKTKKAAAVRSSSMKLSSSEEESSSAAAAEMDTREQFQAINEAYNVLSDKDKRREYDQQKSYEKLYGGLDKGPNWRDMGAAGMGGSSPFGAKSGGGMGQGSGGLNEAQMREAYEMFMRNFAGGGGAAEGTTSWSAKQTKRGSSSSPSSKQKRNPTGRDRQKAHNTKGANAHRRNHNHNVDEDEDSSSSSSMFDSGYDPTAFDRRYDDDNTHDPKYTNGGGHGGEDHDFSSFDDAGGEGEGGAFDQAAYRRDGGEGSDRNMYRDWLRSRNAKRADRERKEEEEAFYAAQRKRMRGRPGAGGSSGEGDVPPVPPKHFMRGRGKNGYSTAYDGSSEDGDGPHNSQRPMGGGGADALRSAGFRNIYDAYGAFTRNAGGGSSGSSSGMAPEGVSDLLSRMFGAPKEDEENKRRRSVSDDPFAHYAVDSSNPEAKEAAKYATLFKEYKAYSSSSSSSSSSTQEGRGSEENKKKRSEGKDTTTAGGEEKEEERATKGGNGSSDEKRTQSEHDDKEREAFIKQFKAFEAYQKSVEEAEARRRAEERAERRTRARQSTFSFDAMFGGKGGGAEEEGKVEGGISHNVKSSTSGDSSPHEEASDANEEEHVEDMFGNRRPKNKKKRNTKEILGKSGRGGRRRSTVLVGAADEKEEVDPLEAAYYTEPANGANHYQDGDGEYLIQEGTSFANRGKRKSQAHPKTDRKKPSTDEEDLLRSFQNFGQYPNTAHDEANKNIPSTQSFSDLARGWAAQMAKQFAGAGAVPEGVVPDESVNPEAAAKAKYAADKSGGQAPKKTTAKKTKKGTSTAPKTKVNTKKKDAPSTTKGETNDRSAKSANPKKSSQKEAASSAKSSEKYADKTDPKWGTDIPDLSTRPSDEEMEELKHIFKTDSPPDRNTFPKKPPPRDDPWWNTIFKDGKGPPPEGVRDVPRVPGKLNGPIPATKGRVAPKGSGTPSSSSKPTGSATAYSTSTSKAKQSTAAARGQPKASSPSAKPPPSEGFTEPRPVASLLTVDEEFGFKKSEWNEYCAPSSGSATNDADENASPSPSPRSKISGPACVVFFSSGTSLVAMNKTIGEVARRFPRTAKTFFVTRPNALKVSDFIYEEIREAAVRSGSHRHIDPSSSESEQSNTHGEQSASTPTGSDVDEEGKEETPSTSNSVGVPPLVMKGALCGASYAKATLSNAGEFCAVIVRGGGRFVTVVGNQRTAHLDFPKVLREELAKNDGALAALREAKGLANKHKKGMANTKDIEAMVYLGLKRDVLSHIDFSKLVG